MWKFKSMTGIYFILNTIYHNKCVCPSFWLVPVAFHEYHENVALNILRYYEIFIRNKYKLKYN